MSGGLVAWGVLLCSLRSRRTSVRNSDWLWDSICSLRPVNAEHGVCGNHFCNTDKANPLTYFCFVRQEVGIYCVGTPEWSEVSHHRPQDLLLPRPRSRRRLGCDGPGGSLG